MEDNDQYIKMGVIVRLFDIEKFFIYLNVKVKNYF